MSGRISPVILGKGWRVPGIGPLPTFWPFVARQPTPVFLPGRFCGQRSLEGYSPWGHKESDVAERLSMGKKLDENSGETLLGLTRERK